METLSLKHPIVKKWIALRQHREAREEAGLVIISGEKLVKEVAQKKPLQTLITLAPSSFPAQNHHIVSEPLLAKITGLKAPDGWAAVVPLPPPTIGPKHSKTLILDQIQDPGNLGTLLRTALALDWNQIILTPGTVDPFNDKALRASQGALFSLPYQHLSVEHTLQFLHTEKITPFLADLEGEPLATATPVTPYALILSNEGNGPSPWAQKIGKKIKIPMHNGVDSLNVAISGAILMYKL